MYTEIWPVGGATETNVLTPNLVPGKLGLCSFEGIRIHQNLPRASLVCQKIFNPKWQTHRFHAFPASVLYVPSRVIGI